MWKTEKNKCLLFFVVSLFINCAVADDTELRYSQYDIYPIFNAHYYLQMNPDVAEAFGGNLAGARSHYLAWGRSEGRKTAPGFHVEEYLKHNPDLKAEYGDDYYAATGHFLRWGINEDRRTTDTFYVKEYLALYEGLRSEYGASNYSGGHWHWYWYGFNEGRRSEL